MRCNQNKIAEIINNLSKKLDNKEKDIHKEKLFIIKNAAIFLVLWIFFIFLMKICRWGCGQDDELRIKLWSMLTIFLII